MSYDIIKDRNARRARRLEQIDLEDIARGQFLAALDNAEFAVTNFEAQFIESYLHAGAFGQLTWWTEKRRAICDRMRQTYGGRL